MRWVDLDTDQGYWRIPDTKNGEPLTVPLVPEALEILNLRRIKHPASNPWSSPAQDVQDI